MANNMIHQINDGQHDTNREFTPVISQAMSPAYDVTAAESGPGCYMRMKNAMHHHVDDNRRVMFDNATKQEQTVRREIDERIAGADDTFQKVLDMNSENLKAASSADSDPINGDAMEIDDGKSAESQQQNGNDEDAEELEGDSRESSTAEAKHSSQIEGVKMEEDAKGGASQSAEVAE
ncbi:hypothetical protein KC316_g11063 [Hortaea werneckii]|nr:hypothetical protein KC324_g5171 [Hortaea werneckii]KAI7575492.1 hypothetical protein KC316_g11063 [Hortaea werneckii]